MTKALQQAATRHWQEADPTMARLSARHPLPPLRPSRDGFGALVESITHQQVSMAAGRTIHGRLVSLVGDVAPDTLLLHGARLREAGLSRAKAAYVLDLAEKTTNGALDFPALRYLSDDEVVAALTQVKGVGVWTAKMYLIFHLGRPDVFAPEDLGIRLAVAGAYRLPPHRVAPFMARRRARWSPYNSVAARVLWQSRDRKKG
ncbi:MAG: DNA-3-methyladenine glycosylase family protein [Thermoplasmatota archaeon]